MSYLLACPNILQCLSACHSHRSFQFCSHLNTYALLLTLIMAFAVIRKRVAFSFTNLSFAAKAGLSSTSWSSTIERCKAEPCLPTRSLQVCRSSSLAFSGLMFSAFSLLVSSSSSGIKQEKNTLLKSCIKSHSSSSFNCSKWLTCNFSLRFQFVNFKPGYEERQAYKLDTVILI